MQSTTFRNRFDRGDSDAGARQSGSAADFDLTNDELALLRTWRIERASRVSSAPAVERITVGDIIIDRAAHSVFRSGREVGLSPKEYELLIALAVRVDTAVPRDLLMTEVWNHHNPGNSRTLDQHVAQLRKKIEDDARDPNYIVTVSKFGYRMSAPRLRIDKS